MADTVDHDTQGSLGHEPSPPAPDIDQNQLESPDDEGNGTGAHHTLAFWLVFVSLCLGSFLAALDVTVLTTALPTIVREIGGEDKYVWIANTYVITSTAIQPLFGQLSDIFGRRYITLIAVALFLLGSGLSGGAVNVAMLISGRSIQGIGSGAIMMLLDLIVCDLVPLRQRPKYLGLVFASSGVSAALGPLIGGAIVSTISWRWVFYINLPIAGVVFFMCLFFLHTKHNKSPTWRHALGRIDYFGNTLFIAAVISLLLGLITGGQVFPWSSFRVILPIVLGGVGIGAFIFYESTSFCKSPTVPLELFGTRTSVIAYVLTFLSAMLLQWVSYYLPIFFQAVQLSTPVRAGVELLPLNIFLIGVAIVGGAIITKTGKYLPIHITSFGLIALGVGLFERMNPHTSTVEWVFLEIVTSSGLALTLNSPLTAIQASLPDSYSASATATYAFLRSFAFVWGITIPAIIFNAEVSKHVGRITTDIGLQSMLSGGGALGFTTRSFLVTLPQETRDQVVSVFSDAISISWYAALAFALLGFVLCFGEKQITLRTTLDTNYGLKEKGDKTTDSEKTGSAGTV
ncbi:MFS general substrate transporter [Nemania abortiva]|nr:MFS general substrate transporter [Nemania abortiva]